MIGDSVMSDEEKVLFKCPVCTKTFRIPASHANRTQCPDCEKAAEREKALRDWARREELEVEAKQQKHVPGRQEASRPPLDQPSDYGFLHGYAGLLRVIAVLGLFFGAVMVFVSFASRDQKFLVPGIVVLVSSAGTIALSELMTLAVNVAEDIKISKVNQEAILQILQSMKKDDG